MNEISLDICLSALLQASCCKYAQHNTTQSTAHHPLSGGFVGITDAHAWGYRASAPKYGKVTQAQTNMKKDAHLPDIFGREQKPGLMIWLRRANHLRFDIVASPMMGQAGGKCVRSPTLDLDTA